MTDLNKVAKIYKTLADPTRLKILRLIKKYPGITTASILENIKVSPSTLTFHIKKLLSIHSIYTTKKGSFLCYHPNLEQFKVVCEAFQKGIDGTLLNFITHEKFVIFQEKDFTEVLKVLGDKTRLEILMLMGNNPGITGKELHILTNESEADISFHTKILEEEKIINSRKISNQVYYWIDLGFIVTFYRFLDIHRTTPAGKSVFDKK